MGYTESDPTVYQLEIKKSYQVLCYTTGRHKGTPAEHGLYSEVAFAKKNGNKLELSNVKLSR